MLRSRHDPNFYTTPRNHGFSGHCVSDMLRPASDSAYQMKAAESTSKERATWDLEITRVLPLLLAIPVLIEQING